MILQENKIGQLITEVREAISENDTARVTMENEIVRNRSDLFMVCWQDYQEQSEAYLFRRPLYVEDSRGSFGFMRLRDDKGRVLGYETDGGDDLTDSSYSPTPADRKRITAAMEAGIPLYYYMSFRMATFLGYVLTEYSRQAVEDYERKRHRLFDITDMSPANSATYMAIYRSYFSQYEKEYDLPTLTAGTEARKGYYLRLIQRAADGEISIGSMRHLPRGKGLHPKTWKNALLETEGVDFELIRTPTAVCYNGYVRLNGETGFPSSEDDGDDMGRMEDGLFWKAVR